MTKERVENRTNGFLLITFNGVGVQVWCLFVANLMADRTGSLDFGSVLFFTAKTRGKRNVCSLRR